ncbi:MAG: hypothetical protein AUI50_07050 [Crenarchaeota archaeon 13_1_40CM_2_52_14]|nr:MAG: hypothetical protein AUI97_07650 [Crenarchaeota archaeon 13_1_40CM_3_52_17]OLD34311.1 MAG: hypothetical protein AUI50_07050 [Crenarchaeota archaeon 13_1_40CM_2_52_14]
MDIAEEQRMLEEKVGKALEEARTKLEMALDSLSKGGADSEKRVWLAEEASEYSSLLYSLTYGLEDEDPPVPVRKRNAESIPLVKESAESLKLATELRGKLPLEGYRHLRNAVYKLRQAHYILEKAGMKKR